MLARIGGLLLIAGSVVAGFWATSMGGPAGPGEVRDDTLLVTAWSFLLGAGAGALSISGATPFGPRLARVGLGVVAVGLLGAALGRGVVVTPGTFLMGSWPYVILGLGGYLLSVIGWLATGLSLVRSPGPGRVVGVIVLLGVPSLVVLLGVGFLIFVAGFVGVGLLALGVRGTPAESVRA